jgi:hypothetical protein
MSCREYRADLIEMARGELDAAERRALAAHVGVCAACARVLEDQMALSTGFASLAAEAVSPGAELAPRVMAEFDRLYPPRVPVWRWALAACLAAAVCLSAARLYQWGQPEPAALVETVDQRPFLVIPYTVPPVPEEEAAVVRTRIPAAALISAGFHVQGADPTTMVEADVLFSQDGRPRAIRPVSISMTD